MAYNNYLNGGQFGYNPAFGQPAYPQYQSQNIVQMPTQQQLQPQVQQPQQYNTQPVQQSQPQQSQPDIQRVMFLKSSEVDDLVVLPYQRVLIIDIDNNVFYIKGADGLGNPHKDTYDFKKRDPSQQIVDIEQKPTAIDMDQFLTKKEFGEVISGSGFLTTEHLHGLESKIGNLQSQIQDITRLNEILSNNKKSEA